MGTPINIHLLVGVRLEQEGFCMLKTPLASIIACTLAIGGGGAWAAQSALDLAKQSEHARERGQAYLKDFEVTQPNDDLVKFAKEIVEGTKETYRRERPNVEADFGIKTPENDRTLHPEGEWIDILVSRSLGEAELEQTIAAAAKSSMQVRFVFRGIGHGERLNDMFADYGRWADGLESPPGAILDPTLFQDHSVTQVPYMMYMRDDKVVASVKGLSNPKWLEDKVKAGETGYLGRQGPTREIAERDLIEVMKERAGKLDLDKRKQETVASYWDRAQFQVLTPAREDRVRRIDPSVVINQPIKDVNGKVIVQAGAVINPLHMRKFTLRLIIFNPTRPSEVKWAQHLAAEEGRQDMFIATQFDRESGWEDLEGLQDQLDAPVYMLTSDVRQRFALERTPTLVTSEGLNFVISEHAVEERVEDDAD